MEIRWLKTFIALAEELNFGRAGRRVGIAQSAVSQQIRQLEEAVGGRLFDRNRQEVTVTAAGKILYTEAKTILSQVEFAGERLRAQFAGEETVLNIGFVTGPSGDVLGPALRRLRQRTDKVRFRVVEIPVVEIGERMQARTLDCVVSPELSPPYPARLRHQKICDERVVLAVPPDSEWGRAGKVVDFRSLHKIPFVFYRPSVTPKYRNWVTEECRKFDFTPKVGAEVDTPTELILSVAGGAGVALLPDGYRHRFSNDVRFAELEPSPGVLGLWLWRRRSERSVLIDSFFESLRAVVKA